MYYVPLWQTAHFDYYLQLKVNKFPFQDFQGPQLKFKDFPGPGIFFCQFQNFPGFSRTVAALCNTWNQSFSLKAHLPLVYMFWHLSLNVLVEILTEQSVGLMLSNVLPVTESTNSPFMNNWYGMLILLLFTSRSIWKPTRTNCCKILETIMQDTLWRFVIRFLGFDQGSYC